MDDIDRQLLERLAGLNCHVRLDELLQGCPIDAAELSVRLFRLEEIGLIRSVHYFKIRPDGAAALSEPAGNAESDRNGSVLPVGRNGA